MLQMTSDRQNVEGLTSTQRQKGKQVLTGSHPPPPPHTAPK